MSEKKKRKSGAGRKKGSVSFCLVPLTELNSKLPTGAIILVSRKFAESMGIEGQPVVSTPNMIMPMVTATKANAVQVTNLNDEETAPELSVDNW
ncbi:hypothetical protein CMI37_27255 [Candidatus Pacearchaeota archaeon]|nr:hypothetical protein [Candidatus Pacearchaeota archaeon]|tara:strand:+ start:1735 stop:2016 length:282 start_codon:yes stop_codon:yes gene_type:complete